ncbi:MAG: hypothetical protein EOP49_39305 [Sphingobacteriales bacterium]|nr:MAG: hypothetical protein EOP49_39305 [Sphingobacteriales bacterium]
MRIIEQQPLALYQPNTHIAEVPVIHFTALLHHFSYGAKESPTYSRKLAPEKGRETDAGQIILRANTLMVQEVEIKGKVNPVRVMQDTVEFNAAAYRVDEGDNVSDLLKQLPGLEVDENYNVKTLGEGMTKLRVNGKDFFTNNVSEFISKLPAEIVSKIQVIDDYGEEANFTGIKTGQPVKMLNIVTKPGMNRGNFGAANLTGGSNEQYGGGGNVNLWRDATQRSVGLSHRTSDNGAGNSTSNLISFTHSDKINKNSHLSAIYSFNGNNNAYKREQLVSTVLPSGTYIDNSLSEGEQAAHRQVGRNKEAVATHRAGVAEGKARYGSRTGGEGLVLGTAKQQRAAADQGACVGQVASYL